MTGPEAPAPPGPGRALRQRYTTADLGVFTPEEARRFVPQGNGDPHHDVVLAWELLYRLEPELYDRLAGAERLHPGVVGWLPCDVDRIAEVGAGTGRLTLELIGRGRHVVAVEPARPLRRILRRKLAAAEHGDRARVVPGFFDQLPLPGDAADLVVAGEVDQASGYVLDLKSLSDLIAAHIIRDVDHHNLNTDVPWLKGRVPTTENLAQAFWERLAPALPEGLLRSVRVWETDKNWAQVGDQA